MHSGLLVGGFCPRECLRLRDKAYFLQQGYGATPLPSEAPCTDGCICGTLLLGRQPWRCGSCLHGESEGVSVLCVVKVWGFWLVDATCEAKRKYGSGAALKHGVERWKLSVAWCLQWSSSKRIWLPLLSVVETRFHSLTLIIAWITQGSLMSFRAVEMNITT
ncbi:hypothetical protein GOP47_0027233 [Adiantum capillus-veneris]|nr:hypothetical protein GOP47_0027233 [Adiantum capillus-veneris]